MKWMQVYIVTGAGLNTNVATSMDGMPKWRTAMYCAYPNIVNTVCTNNNNDSNSSRNNHHHYNSLKHLTTTHLINYSRMKNA